MGSKSIKHIIYFLIIFLILAALAVDFYRPIVLSVSQRQLNKVLGGSAVSIEDCHFAWPHKLSFFNLTVQKDKVYDFKAGKIDIYFDLASILTRTIPKIVLHNSHMNIDLSKKSILELGQYFNQGPGGKSAVEGLTLEGMTIHVKSNEINMDARVSADLDLVDRSVSSIDLNAASIESNGVIIKGALLNLSPVQDQGKLAIGSITYNKAQIKELNGIVHGKDANIFLDFLSVKTFGGRLEGSVSLQLGVNPQYLADLKITDMNIERIVSDFDLGEKIQMDGKLSGELIIEGKGGDMRVLSGNFASEQSGGTLMIKDTRFLENMARGGNQPVELLIDNFKNYHYNTGTMKLSLVEEGLNLEMALDGEAGKRNLNIMLHNFIKRDGL